MLPKINRLTKNKEFESVVKNSRTLSTANFVVKYNLDNNSNKTKKRLKIAVSVGTKISRKAVERNKLRRQISDVLRNELTNKNLNSAWQILVVPKKTALEVNYANLREEIKLLLNKIIKNG